MVFGGDGGACRRRHLFTASGLKTLASQGHEQLGHLALRIWVFSGLKSNLQMSDNALLKELAAARAARRGEPTLVGEPAAAAPAAAAERPAAPAPAQTPARTTREVISIDDSDDERRKGVIEIHSESDDDALAARRVTTDAIDLTRDSDEDEGPRKRQRTTRPPRPPPPQRPRIQVIRNYGGVQGLVVAPRFLSEAAERRLFESMGTRCPLPTGQVESGYGRSDLTNAPRGRYDRFSPDLWRCIMVSATMSTPNCYCPTLRYSGAIDRSGSAAAALSRTATPSRSTTTPRSRMGRRLRA